MIQYAGEDWPVLRSKPSRTSSAQTLWSNTGAPIRGGLCAIRTSSLVGLPITSSNVQLAQRRLSSIYALVLRYLPAMVEGENIHAAKAVTPSRFNVVGALPGDVVEEDFDKGPGVVFAAAFLRFAKCGGEVHRTICFAGGQHDVIEILFLDFDIAAGSKTVDVAANVMIEVITQDLVV